jgi:hypothetical protein
MLYTDALTTCKTALMYHDLAALDRILSHNSTLGVFHKVSFVYKIDMAVWRGLFQYHLKAAGVISLQIHVCTAYACDFMLKTHADNRKAINTVFTIDMPG